MKWLFTFLKVPKLERHHQIQFSVILKTLVVLFDPYMGQSRSGYNVNEGVLHKTPGLKLHYSTL